MRFTSLCLCLLLLLSLTMSVSSQASVLYVNNVHGSDLYDGSLAEGADNYSGPVRSIRRALRLARQGDRIVLANTGTPYREGVSFYGGRNSGLIGRPFILEGNGAVLDGSQPIPARAWRHFRGDVYRYRPHHLGHQMLFMDGKPAQRHPAPRTVEEVPDLAPLQWVDHGAYVYFRTEKGVRPDVYPLSHAVEGVGITLFQVRDVVVTNLTIQGFRIDGVSVFDDAHCLLGGLICRGNGRSGVFVGGSSRAIIRSCLIGNNGKAELMTDGYSQTRVRDTELVKLGAPPVVRRDGLILIEPIVESPQDDPSNGPADAASETPEPE